MLNSVILCIILLSMKKEKQKIELKEKSKQTFTMLNGIIIALLATIGLLNRSIGSFVTFGFYVLFGNAYILFFVYLILYALVLLYSRGRKVNRLFITSLGLIFILLGVSGLFFYKEVPHPSFADIGLQIKEMGPFKDAMTTSRPNIVNSYRGGLVGGLIYTLLYLMVQKVASVVILAFIILIGFTIVIWPLIKRFYLYVKDYINVLRKRQQFFNKASQIAPQSASESRLSSKPEPINRPTYQAPTSNVSVPQVKSISTPTGLKPVSFGQTVTKQSIGLSPVAQSFAKQSTPEPKQEKMTLERQSAPSFKYELRFNLNFNVEKEAETQLVKEESTIPIVKETLDEPILKATPPIPTPMPVVEPVRVEPIYVPELEEEEEIIVKPKVKKPKVKTTYTFPPSDLLIPDAGFEDDRTNERAAEEALQALNQQFVNLNIGAQAVSYTIGPSITRFDIRMNDDESVNTINKYIPDLNIRLGGIHGRFEQVVAGKDTSGFEIPNKKTKIVRFRSCFEKLPKLTKKTKMIVPFGMDISGEIINGSLDEFPHLLVAGATGSGKSIYMHSILLTLIMRNTPDELRLLIIDPKRVEMARYAEMPHLLCPIVKEPKDAKVAFYKLVNLMEERYLKFEETGASKLSEYNEIAEEEGLEPMARIVVVVDEYADLVESEGDISTPILRLAQKSRACGIHLIISTQRPSVNIITGTIKANLPTRVALMVSSATDSKTILGQGGAEDLLGYGDMLVDCTQLSRSGFTRIQGAFVEGTEIRSVVRFLKENVEVNYYSDFLDLSERSSGPAGLTSGLDGGDDRYLEIKQWVLTQDRVSKNKLSNTFNIGFNRALKIYDMLIADGVIVETDEANSSRGAKVVVEESSPGERRIEQFYE
jgi:DNA segregation ATPase FtsK/SpoIIIE-like protein